MKQKPATSDTSSADMWRVQMIALGYAGILTVMATLQLFEFEEFMPLVESFWLPGGVVIAALIASLIVACEVLALPFLLRMSLSPLMRYVSMVCGLLVPAGWLTIAIWLNVTHNVVDNIGFLGTKVTLPVGWWAVYMTLALLVAAIWSAWGMNRPNVVVVQEVSKG